MNYVIYTPNTRKVWWKNENFLQSVNQNYFRNITMKLWKEVDLSLATKLVISYYNWLPNKYKYIKILYIYIYIYIYYIYIYYIYIIYITRHLGTHIIFNQLVHIISSFLLDEINLTLEIRIWLKIVLLYLLITFQILLQQFPADKWWIWSCIGY